MTASPEPVGRSHEDAPYLPPRQPVVPDPVVPRPDASSVPPPPPAGSPVRELPLPGSWPPPSDGESVSATLPSVDRDVVSTPDPEFDAKALVESQKHFKPAPAYGPMPAGTPEGRAEAARRRAEANRKRRRNRMIAWMVGVGFLIAIAAAGYLAYRSYQDEADSGGVPFGDGIVSTVDSV